ncbi:MAG: 4-hydroxythreonine-4-phosphate dehydrogenase PdxA, partial [Candidatus Omnitrophica bacterium]|nr:4-hydroxythreonine-4-phosphate dehydrogenase PdxA [Candidatus Omnitrophota bacterium]
IDMDNISSRDYKLGCPNRKTALASKQYIDEAIKLAKLGDVDCVVTGPIHKKSMNSINFGLPGHTEYIAHQCNVKDFAMMMVSGYFKVILVTTHIPLKEVAYAIKKETIFKKIKLAHTFLRSYFGIAKPKIALCALNPHSGEDGILGQEEKEILLPAVRYAQRANIDITGPLPSDSLFSKAFKGIYDAVVCLYHDQAMIPIKIFGLENTVNITLGLPFIRTSPAHGTAHDIADKFVADENSMHSAIKLAIEIYRNRLRGSF